MGSPKDEKGRRQDEVQHPVTLSRGYWLGMHEVSLGEWLEVMGSLPPSRPNYCDAECPVAGISWEDAQEFIRKLERKESYRGYRYRLPTEAEWEYAARAGTTGASYGDLDQIAWYTRNSSGKLNRVGSREANAWGLHDMLSNVREWTADWYGAYRTYNGFAAVDPSGPSTGSGRVARGGGRNGQAGDVRAAARFSESPSSRSDSNGFRLVRYDPLTPVPGLVWKNSLGAEFAWIPPGTFRMGSPESEEGRQDDEGQHEVTISKGFWMGRYEVTQAEWEAVMGSNPAFPGCSARCPVNQVSWLDIRDFLTKLNERERGRKADEPGPDSGYVYRLPTEAEWEYAARAGTTGAFYGELDSIAWYVGNWGPRKNRLREVGQKQANAWGLHDVLGNAREWTASHYGEYPSGAVTDPNLDYGYWRVIRGGGIYESPRYLRVANRREFGIEYSSAFLGLRLVKGPPPQLPPPLLPSTVPVPGASWTNTAGMEFVGVPAGTFQMGSPADEEGRYADEVQHEVTITKAFWMGKYEVTRREWEAVMGSPFPPYRLWGNYGSCNAPECPVESPTWDEAQEFIGKLNERESGRGYVYRLPTEAEWEYAARAGTTGARYGDREEVAVWFSAAEGLEWLEWYEDATSRRSGDPPTPPAPGPTPALHPVGGKRANAWGLHDMLGNLWELTADWYGEYPSGAVTDPVGPSSGRFRVIRGGTLSGPERMLRAAMRGPYWRPAGNTPFTVSGGIRLVRTD